MKKIKPLSLILAIFMLVSLVPVKTFAVTPLDFIVEPNTTNAVAGDEVTYTVKIGAVENLASIKFILNIPTGLTFLEGCEQPDLATTLNSAVASFEPSTLTFMVGYSDYTSTTQTTLMTFKCKVNEGATGTQTVNLTIDEDDIFDTSAGMVNIPFQCVTTGLTVTTNTATTCDHSMAIEVPAKDATCTEDGNTAYKYCENCNSYLDLSGNVLATSPIIPMLGHDFSIDQQDEQYTWKKCSHCDEISGKTLKSTSTQTSDSTPGTGDESNIVLWKVILCGSFAIFLFVSGFKIYGLWTKKVNER